MSMLIDVADAVVRELCDGDFDLPFSPERALSPRYDREKLKSLTVTVVPAGVEVDSATRELARHDVKVYVAVQQIVRDEHATARLLDLVEDIATFLRRRRLKLMPHASWVTHENDPAYSVEHLIELNTFTSVLTVSYRVLA